MKDRLSRATDMRLAFRRLHESGCFVLPNPWDVGSAPARPGLQPPLLSLMVLDWTADATCSKHREFLVGWVHRVLANLERWLADRDFIATTDFTVADLLMAHVLHSGIKDKVLIAPYPGLASYRDRCLARPAWQRTLKAYFARVEAG